MIGIKLIILVFVIGLFLYSKLTPHKDKLDIKYRKGYNFFNSIFKPLLSFLNNFFKPLNVGTGLYVDMAQIVLLLIMLTVLIL